MQIKEIRQPAEPVRSRLPEAPRAQRLSARALGALTPRVTKTAFEKFGFATAQLVADWERIVGTRLATATAPDRIRWPRRPGEADLDEARGSTGPRAGATLVVRVEPAVALDVQYQSALIVDRVNAFFGYRAVADLRIVQGRVAPDHQPPEHRESAVRPRVTSPPVAISGIADDGLKAALERMQSYVRTRRG